MFVYKIDVMKKMKEKGYTAAILKTQYKIGDSQLDKLRKRETIGINVLDKICTLLELQPGSILKHVPDPIGSKPKPEASPIEPETPGAPGQGKLDDGNPMSQ